jgi:hypothetical protein
MSKYQSLNQFFKAQTSGFLRMTFDEVEKEAGFKLPASARLHQAWWANDRDRHVQAKAWLDAGYESEQVDMKAGTLVFRRVPAERVSPLGKPGGMSDPAREFTPAETSVAEKKPRRSPLFGALKGTFWIDPTWDVTKPAMDADELAEMFANIERTADLIEAGLSKKRK